MVAAVPEDAIRFATWRRSMRNMKLLFAALTALALGTG
jgi:hypothetical protein